MISSVYALMIAVTGGFTIAVAGIRLSTHAVVRPIVVALVLGLCGIVAAPPGHNNVLTRVTGATVHRLGFITAALIAAVVGIVCYVQGAHVASAADPSGYLSQARLWRAGDLHIHTPLALEIDTEHGQYVFTPLGYQPSATRGVAVPGYPPGLPLHFAAAKAIAGEQAQFAVMPLSAAGLVIVAFLFGRRLGGSETAILSAALCAASPMLLFQASQPMSDAVAAFWWSLAVLLLTYDSIWSAAIAGAAAAVACGVRPNLFAMVPVMVILAAWWRGRITPLSRWIAFLASPAIAAFALAAMQRSLFGSATTSGYGAVGSLFSLDHVWPNLGRYAKWALFTQSALILVPIAAPFVIRRGWIDPWIDRGRAIKIATSALVFFAALQVFYLLYIVLDEWISFRFLLPALPWLLVMQAAVFAALCRRLPVALRSAAVVAVAVMVCSWQIERAHAIGAFQLHRSERRYLDVAGFARTLPANAVFMTLHHSGSLPYYIAATVLRWDWLQPHEIDRVVAEIAAKGRPLYAVIDDLEEPQFRTKFAGTRTAARLGTPVFSAGDGAGITSRVYLVTE